MFFRRTKAYDPSCGHVFIVTYGRSGSTLLMRFLQSIDGAHIRGENLNALYDVFRACSTVARLRGEFGDAPRAVDHPFYGADQVDSDGFRRDLVQSFVRRVLRPPKHPRWLGFKEIRAYEAVDQLEAYLDFLQEHFHNAKIIFNRRAVADVQKSSWWATMDPAEVSARLERLHGIFAAYASAHPDAALVMDYEDYKQDISALKPLFALLDEPFQAGRLSEILGTRLHHG